MKEIKNILTEIVYILNCADKTQLRKEQLDSQAKKLELDLNEMHDRKRELQTKLRETMVEKNLKCFVVDGIAVILEGSRVVVAEGLTFFDTEEGNAQR